VVSQNEQQRSKFDSDVLAGRGTETAGAPTSMLRSGSEATVVIDNNDLRAPVIVKGG